MGLGEQPHPKGDGKALTAGGEKYTPQAFSQGNLLNFPGNNASHARFQLPYKALSPLFLTDSRQDVANKEPAPKQTAHAVRQPVTCIVPCSSGNKSLMILVKPAYQ